MKSGLVQSKSRQTVHDESAVDFLGSLNGIFR
ncbi:hypothetical protein HAINFHK1212_1621 [Haemophilus influenzae HK1212]|uniref:Uncharacterized protein n=1 Tax=Haemophilus influenzae HK1212 TaxID=456482 RepID=A0A7G2JXZ3_HAEIF|nr:hypothetical protein HAINFHK1212_2038 [Haemophilus influenzae HK1212]EFA27902.1 hypothetical protein HAINFHK1212_1403 [Haemophilus influenzae HK1212]EFA27999.1 hypothetical protein HAINFHK1212_1616 [Haemophilus influenzae HK1212]EFA28183.1 hypothetical protein HAINFHK1212_0607 [Haemophilus influenzae HK1212]EFA28203.1 hypothetical protein HAINFHK1212_0668 [Haemophilus influenzae HK1212]